MLNLKATGPYGQKDQRKADLANKFIGIGSPGSSTAHYAAVLDPTVVNCGAYSETDTVFISINGARPNRVGIAAIRREIIEAVKADVIFVTDGPHDRARSYNVGEREVAELLSELGYVWQGNAWTPGVRF